MDYHMNEYINPVYLEEESPGLLVPNLCPQNIKYDQLYFYRFEYLIIIIFIRFWRGMYCRFESGVHPREPLGDLLLATCDHSHSLEDHIKYLTKVSKTIKNSLCEIN